LASCVLHSLEKRVNTGIPGGFTSNKAVNIRLNPIPVHKTFTSEKRISTIQIIITIKTKKTMKKIIIVLVCGMLYTSASINQATAQKATNASFETPTIEGQSGESADKASASRSEADLKAAKVNLKVTNHLSKQFRNMSNLKWSTEEKVIVATFKIDEKSGRVVYNKKGNWLYSIITYTEDQMPKEVKFLINDAYPGYNITLVHEITQGSTFLYDVFIEDSSHLKQILVQDQDLTVYKEYTKSK
jgi:hypothetical protein